MNNAVDRARNDAINHLSVYVDKHSEESPEREDIFEQLGVHFEAVGRAIPAKISTKTFRQTLIDIAVYAMFAASKQEPK